MFIERKSKEENIGHKVIENFIEQKPIKLFEEFIQNNDWEGLAQLLKDKYTKELLEDIYPESVNSNTKVFVDTLALHSMKHLFEYLQNELNESYSNLNELFKVSDLLVIKREELKKQLHETEQQVIDINATIITKSDLLDKSKNTAKIILENIKAFKERLDKNKQKLDEWQQVLKLNISEWTCDNVVLFLEEIGLKTYSQVFLNNKIDGIVLQSLDTNELMTLQLSFKDAKKISMYLYLIELNRDIYTIPPGVLQWNNKTVCTWLEDNKFSHLVDIFEKNQVSIYIM